jgi:hypothetical protein
LKARDVPLGTTAEHLTALLPQLLALKPNDTLRFVRYRRRRSGKSRASSKRTDCARVAEWLRQESLRARDFTSIRASELTTSRLARAASEAKRHDRSLALCSTCIAGGQILHIPLIDLRVPAGTRAQHQLECALAQMRLPGVVLKSGRSFHVYGCRLMSQPQWLDFIATFLLLDDMVDWRYVGHCLRRQMSTLRIYGKKQLHLREPKVVACVNA